MQRVPFVARTYLKENGQYESNILSLKKELFIAAIPYLYSKKVASLMEELLHIKNKNCKRVFINYINTIKSSIAYYGIVQRVQKL